MRNRYAGRCLVCETIVNPGEGYFQRKSGRWLVRCRFCVGSGNKSKKDKIIKP